MIVLTGKKGDVTHLAFSPTSNLLAASGGGRGLELWDVATTTMWGKHDRIRFQDGSVSFHPTQPICFSPVYGGLVEIETDTKKACVLRLKTTNSRYYAITIDTGNLLPNGAGFICIFGSYQRIRWSRGKSLSSDWNAPVTAQSRSRQSIRPRLLRISPNGKSFVTLTGSHNMSSLGYRLELTNVEVRSTKDGELLGSGKLKAETSLALAISPDSKLFVTCRKSYLDVGSVSAPTAEPDQLKADNRARFIACAFHPSGRYLAAASNDGTVKFYDTTSWKIAKSLTWDIGKLRSLAFSPDGTLAAAGSDSGKVVVWDVDV